MFTFKPNKNDQKGSFLVEIANTLLFVVSVVVIVTLASEAKNYMNDHYVNPPIPHMVNFKWELYCQYL